MTKKTSNPINPGLLQSIPYDFPGKRILVETETGEFTCLCPWTGQPDFAAVKISYVPAKKCVELKSLKLYLQSYRNAGIVHESVVNAVLDDLVQVCSPVEMKVTAVFNVRGGFTTTVTREYKRR